MRFEYPYKLYRIGFILYFCASIYGLYALSTFPTPPWLRICAILLIVLLLRPVYRFYLFHYYRLMSYAIQVDPDRLVIRFEAEEHPIPDENIRMIYYATQIEQFKVYRVLHLFTVDNRHFYFSNELLRFKQLVPLLEKRYRWRFRRIDHLLRNFRNRDDEGDFYSEYLHNKKS